MRVTNATRLFHQSRIYPATSVLMSSQVGPDGEVDRQVAEFGLAARLQKVLIAAQQ